jgi:hypothetical protein
MRILRFVRIGLCLLLAIWFLVDGITALTTGNYITPSSGAYAGSLGPWASALWAMNIDPLGQPAKIAFVLLGIIWLVHARNVIVRKVVRPATVLLCVLTLWYLPFGTIVAIEELLSEFVPALNRATKR